jgi:hypothetical protein
MSSEGPVDDAASDVGASHRELVGELLRTEDRPRERQADHLALDSGVGMGRALRASPPALGVQAVWPVAHVALAQLVAEGARDAEVPRRPRSRESPTVTRTSSWMDWGK